MKKVLSIGLITALCFSGCTENDPKSAAENFFNAIKDGNVSDFKKYSTDSTRTLIGLQLGMTCSQQQLSSESGLSECMKKTFSRFDKFKAISSTENGNPSSVIVTIEEYTKTGQIAKENINVEKFDEEWKVNLKK